MSKDSVIVRYCNDYEMLEILVNNEFVFHGNYWDFQRPEDIVRLLEHLDINLVEDRKDYEDWEETDD